MNVSSDFAKSDYTTALGLRLTQSAGIQLMSFGSGVRRYTIKALDGTILGDLYGLILESRRGTPFAIVGDEIRLETEIPDFPAFESLVLDRIRGSFAVVTHTGLAPRLYPDCASTMPIVYCPATRQAGSSAATILDGAEYDERFLPGRHRRLVRRRGLETWIPGGLTAHSGVFRLLPNHYLDLTDWRPVRFWPRQGAFTRELSTGAAAEAVAEELEDYMRAAAADHRVSVALTAGHDSRLLLAATRGVADRIDFFTFYDPQPGIDPVIARQIAKALGVTHRIRPFLSATPDEQAAWDRANGDTIRHPNRLLHPSVRQLDCNLILTGILGETGRSRMYRDEVATVDDVRPTAAAVLARMNMPADPELVADVEDWVAGLDWLPFSAVLDLAMLEMFYMPLFRPAQFAQIPELMPFAERAVQTVFLSVPPAEKAGDRLFRAAIGRLWPQASELPFNRYGDYRDLLGKLAKLGQPDRVIPHVQRRLSRFLVSRGAPLRSIR